MGIPDGRDVLAVYLSWVKQSQYRAHKKMGVESEIATSVRSTVGDWEPLVPQSPAIKPEVYSGLEFLGLGGQFE
jgi:hypothetical protein